MLKWEKIDEHTMRVKVPGGWLVKHSQVIVIRVPVPSKAIIGQTQIAEMPSAAMGMTFVPDPDYKWELEKDEEEEKPKAGLAGLNLNP